MWVDLEDTRVQVCSLMVRVQDSIILHGSIVGRNPGLEDPLRSDPKCYFSSHSALSILSTYCTFCIR